MDTSDETRGTKSKRTKRRDWCITLFTVGTVIDDAFKALLEHEQFRYLVYQIEKCPTTGTLHVQAYAEFKSALWFTTICNLLKPSKFHVEPREGTRDEARGYCMSKTWKGKDKGQQSGPVEHGTWIDEKESGRNSTRSDLASAREIITRKRKVDELYQTPELDIVMAKFPRWAENVLRTRPRNFVVEIELRPWQKYMMNRLEQPSVHRVIYWIWSREPNTGKSTFSQYVSSKMDVLFAVGKMEDVLHAFDENQITWFDFARSQEKYVSYMLLEKLSNHGWITSPKYHSGRKFVQTHVVCTSNFPAPITALPKRVIEVDISSGLIIDHTGEESEGYTPEFLLGEVTVDVDV